MKSLFKAVCVSAVAATMLVAAAAPAVAQTGEFRQQLIDQLEFARELAKDAGLDVVAGPFFGGLAEGATETYTISVVEGKNYLIGGVCDTDCSDLDIRIYNTGGDLIGEDTLDDDVPVVELVPTNSGRVKVEVTMHACSSEPCFFAAEVYGDQ